MVADLIRRVFVLALFAVIAIAMPAVAQDKAYVLFSIPQLAGDGVDPGHEGWIDALSFAGGTEREPLPPGPGGTEDINIGVGTPSPIVFTKPADRSSFMLPLLLVSRSVIPEVTIDLCGPPGAGQQCDFSIALTNARIQGVEVGGSSCVNASSCGSATLTEKVTLRFETIVWRHEPSDSEWGWNVIQSTGIQP